MREGAPLLVAALLSFLPAEGAGAIATYGRWSYEARIVAEETVEGDRFGTQVALSGSTLAVGAERWAQDDVGAVYVFERVGSGEWEVTARLVAPDGAAGDRFGESLAFDGATLVVGAPDADALGGDSGAAYVFVPDGAGGWSEGAKLVASDGTLEDAFGSAVGVDGDQILVGGDSGRGVGVARRLDAPFGRLLSDGS